MATKLKIINELFNDTVDTISSNSDNWQDFLRCAAMNYKYSFSDQLLIYAQRPNAVACADFDTWNNVLNRYIKPKCTGIALLTEYNGIPRIRYVWDLYDTRSMYYKSRRKVKIWHVNKIYEKSLTEALENKYGNFENKEKFIDVIYSFVDVLVDNNYPDYYSDFIKNKNNLGYEQLPDETLETNFKDILKKSIAYMLVIRCCSKENRNYTDNDFNIIKKYIRN